MRMTLDEFAARFPDRARPIPVEYAAEWIAWNDDQSEIVAHGADLHETCREATQRGCARPVLQRVPNGPCVGGI